MSIREQIKQIPKVELHYHLEGGLRLTTIKELCEQLGVNVPGVDPSNPDDLTPYRSMFCSAVRVESLPHFLENFWHVQSLLCSEDIIERISYEAVVDAYHNGIRLLEIRYDLVFMSTSNYRDHSHLTYDLIHKSIVKGIRRAEQEVDVAVGLIGVLNRATGTDLAQKVVEFMIEHKDEFVGIDIANDERYSCVPFAPLYALAASHGLGLTCHAGESTTAESVREAIDHLKVSRIGHGFRAIDDDEVVQLVVDKDVLFELCPMSNVLSGSVKDLPSHPVRRLWDKGIKVCINSDDPGMFDSPLLNDYEVLLDSFNFTWEEFHQANLYALEKSFLIKEKVDYVRDQYFQTVSFSNKEEKN